MLRTVLAAILVIALIPTVIVANSSTWALRTVLDDEAFTATVARSLEAPAVEAAIAETATDIAVAQIAQADPVVLQLAAAALRLQGRPTDDALEAALAARIIVALDDPRVRDARDDVVRAVHRFLIGAAEGENTIVSIQGPQVVVDLRSVVEEATDAIDPRIGAVIGSTMDVESARVVVAEAEAFQQVQTGVRILEVAQWIVPLIALLACLLIVVVAHRRTRALAIVGVAVMIAGVVSLGIVWAGGAAVAGAPMDASIDVVVNDVYAAMTSPLLLQSVVLATIGAIVAAAAWFAWRRRREVSRADVR